jgi:hypothetical protein
MIDDGWDRPGYTVTKRDAVRSGGGAATPPYPPPTLPIPNRHPAPFLTAAAFKIKSKIKKQKTNTYISIRAQ